MLMNTTRTALLAVVLMSVSTATFSQDASSEESSVSPSAREAKLEKRIIELEDKVVELELKNERLLGDLDSLKQAAEASKAIRQILSQMKAGTTFSGQFEVAKSSIDAKLVVTKKNEKDLDGTLYLDGGKEAYMLDGEISVESDNQIAFTLKKVLAGTKDKNAVGSVQWKAFVTPTGCLLNYQGQESDRKARKAVLSLEK